MADKGHWYTDKNGNHYFVGEGETPKEGWERTKRRKMRDGEGYKLDDGDGKGPRAATREEYEAYEGDDDFDETVEDDFGFDEEESIEGEKYSFEDEVEEIIDRLKNESGQYYDATSFAEQKLKDYDPKAKAEALKRFRELGKKSEQAPQSRDETVKFDEETREYTDDELAEEVFDNEYVYGGVDDGRAAEILAERTGVSTERAKEFFAKSKKSLYSVSPQWEGVEYDDDDERSYGPGADEQDVETEINDNPEIYEGRSDAETIAALSNRLGIHPKKAEELLKSVGGGTEAGANSGFEETRKSFTPEFAESLRKEALDIAKEKFPYDKSFERILKGYDGDEIVDFMRGFIGEEEILKRFDEAKTKGGDKADQDKRNKPQTAKIGGNIDAIAKEVAEKFGEEYVTSDKEGRVFLKDPKGFKPVEISNEEEIPEGAIVKIMPNWLDKGENPDSTYFVKEDRGDRLVVWSPKKSSSFGGYTMVWPKNTMYVPSRNASKKK